MTTATAPLPLTHAITIPAGITLRGIYITHTNARETALCKVFMNKVVWDWCELALDPNNELLVIADHAEPDLLAKADEIVVALHALGYPNAHTVID